ncbi:ImcF-related family protein, partial [Raoultella sp. 18098]|uniref:ImcF-related family protein n=1 Tax=Raoultella sp. 18098 TaxID=2681430 RepID=UPI00272B1BB4
MTTTAAARTPALPSKLPQVGTTIFAVMSALAAEHGAVNLGQGFPDFDCDPALVDAVAHAMRAGQNQYPPMPGVPALRQAVEESRDADPDNMVALLPLLNHAEALAVSQRYTGDSPPLSWRYGLLQVPKVQTAADATYMRLLEDAWLPRLARHLRNSLQQASTSNPEASYEALKVYLMLYEPDRFNPRVVKAWMLNEWESTLPPALVQSGMVDQLAHHLDRLME